jgi:probable phosphoglycerate mutase
MATILYLIRHGETEWNKARRIQGHSDIALNASGILQAERLAEWYKTKAFHAIYASDLERARHTANRLAEAIGISVRTLPSLRERCYGEWEGLTYEEIRARFHAVDPDPSLYGIESFEAMQQRAAACLTGLAAAHINETIAAVSHGGFINAFLHLVTEGKQGTGISRIDNTGVCVFRYANDRWEVLKVNDTAHLQS